MDDGLGFVKQDLEALVLGILSQPHVLIIVLVPQRQQPGLPLTSRLPDLPVLSTSSSSRKGLYHKTKVEQKKAVLGKGKVQFEKNSLEQRRCLNACFPLICSIIKCLRSKIYMDEVTFSLGHISLPTQQVLHDRAYQCPEFGPQHTYWDVSLIETPQSSKVVVISYNGNYIKSHF